MWVHVRQLFKDAAIYAVGNASSSLLGLLLVPLYTHTLTTAEFGAYSLLFVAYSLMGVASECSLNEGLARLYIDGASEPQAPEHRSAKRRLVSTTFAAVLVLTTLTSICCYLAADWLALWLFREPSYGHHLRIISAALFLRGLGITPTFYLRMLGRSVTVVLLTLSQVILFLALNVVLLSVYRYGVEGIFYSLLLSTGVSSIASLAIAARELPFEIEWGAMGELFRFSLPLGSVSLLMWVIDFSDRYLLNHYTTEAEVGLYSLGYRFGQAILLLITPFSLAWSPTRYGMLSLVDPQLAYGRMATFYVAITSGAWLALALYSSEVLAAMSAPQFHRAASFVAPVALAYVAYGLFVFTVTGLGVAKRVRSLPGIMVLAALANIVLNVIGIPRLGAMAAAYSTIVAYSLMTASTLYFSQKAYAIRYEYGKCAILLGGAILLAVFGFPLGQLSLVVALGLKFLLLVAYAAMIVVTKVFTTPELERAAHALVRHRAAWLGGDARGAD